MIIELEINDVSELIGSGDKKIRFVISKSLNTEESVHEKVTTTTCKSENTIISDGSKNKDPIHQVKIKNAESVNKKNFLIDILKILDKEPFSSNLEEVQELKEEYFKSKDAIALDREIISFIENKEQKTHNLFLKEAIKLHTSASIRLFYRIFKAEALVDLLNLEKYIPRIPNEADRDFLDSTIAKLKKQQLISDKVFTFCDFSKELLTYSCKDEIIKSYKKYEAFANTEKNYSETRLNFFDIPILQRMLRDRLELLSGKNQDFFLLKARTLNVNLAYRVLYRILGLTPSTHHFIELCSMIKNDLEKVKPINEKDYNFLSLLLKKSIEAHTLHSDKEQREEFKKVDHQKFVDSVRKRFEN